MNSMRVADYIAQHLADQGIRQIFLVTGGGAMHLNDALGSHPDLAYVACHHEQACAMAAEGYARITNQPACVNVTAGPGGINALNGVFGAFTDSIPMLVLSGQAKRETGLFTHHLGGTLRQLGDQEIDIIGMVRNTTKYAVLVIDPTSIRYHLEKAIYLCRHGRPGPCWLDIPVDVQGSMIAIDELKGFDPQELPELFDKTQLAEICRDIVARFKTAQRPVILAGTGVRLAGAIELFQRVAEKLGAPVATAWTHDLIPTEHPLFCGRQGSIGDRAGNFTVQNSDVLLVLGSRLTIRQVSYNWNNFARYAYKIQVDIDPAELNKPLIKPDLPVTCDVKVFLEELERQIEIAAYNPLAHQSWVDWCKERVRKYPVFDPIRQASHDGAINPYHFAKVLFEELADDDVIVCGDATACIVFTQSAVLRGAQRIFSNSGCASMGHDLPAAIGAAVARGGKRVICLAGDGSVMMNLQELQTVSHYKWPIKLFVLNNGGYLSIRQTQSAFFKKIVGCGLASGVSFPDFQRVGDAFNLKTNRLERADFRAGLRETLASEGPELCEVILDQAQGFEPKLSSRKLEDGKMISSPLEDMAPFLPREELRQNMLVPTLEV